MSPVHPRRIAALMLALSLGAAAVGLGAAPAAAEEPPTPAPAACLQPEGNARFVRFIYLQILHRCPEPAALAYFTKRLDAGLTRFNFTETIDMSFDFDLATLSSPDLPGRHRWELVEPLTYDCGP